LEKEKGEGGGLNTFSIANWGEKKSRGALRSFSFLDLTPFSFFNSWEGKKKRAYTFRFSLLPERGGRKVAFLVLLPSLAREEERKGERQETCCPDFSFHQRKKKALLGRRVLSPPPPLLLLKRGGGRKRKRKINSPPRVF